MSNVKLKWFKQFLYHRIPQLEMNGLIFAQDSNINSDVMVEIFNHSITHYVDWAIPKYLVDYCFYDISLEEARIISDNWIRFIEIKQKIENETNEIRYEMEQMDIIYEEENEQEDEVKKETNVIYQQDKEEEEEELKKETNIIYQQQKEKEEEPKKEMNIIYQQQKEKEKEPKKEMNIIYSEQQEQEEQKKEIND